MDDDQTNKVVAEALEWAARSNSSLPLAAVEKMVRKWLAISEIGVAALEMDQEMAQRQVDVFEVFVPHMADGKRTWLELFVALTDEDRVRLTELCGDDSVETIARVLELPTTHNGDIAP